MESESYLDLAFGPWADLYAVLFAMLVARLIFAGLRVRR